MTSKKQIIANRKNALKSTGPSTELGKSLSSVNATKHGLRSRQVVIEGESQAEFDDFRLMIIEHYAPADPIEASLVDRVTVCLWRLRRTETIEAQMFDNLRADLIDDRHKNKPNPLVITIEPDLADSSGQRNVRLEICLKMKEIFEQYLECKHSPEVAAELPVVEASIKYYRENPNTYYIPAERRKLQFVREEFELSDQKTREIDEGIEYLIDLEKQAVEENMPNLGHTVSADLTANNILSKFTRYESHIQSSLFKAMHELERLQKARNGDHVPPPQTLDIDIDINQ